MSTIQTKVGNPGYVFDLCAIRNAPIYTVLSFLDTRDLNRLSPVSKKIYMLVFNAATVIAPAFHRIALPSCLAPLTFSERQSPYAFRASIVGKNAPEALLRRRSRLSSFASHPLYRPPASILDRVFLQRTAPVVASPEHQEWIAKTVFAGPGGVENPALLKTIRQLARRYQQNPTPLILELLRQVQSITLSTIFNEIIQLLEQGFEEEISQHPTFLAFEGEILGALDTAHCAQSMQDIIEFLNAHPADLIGIDLFIQALKPIIPAIEVITPSIPQRAEFFRIYFLELFKEVFGFCEQEFNEIREALILSRRYYYHFIMHDSVEEALAEIGDVPAYLALLDRLKLNLQKGIENRGAPLINKRREQEALLYRAIFLEDKESLKHIIESHAFFYFEWGSILKSILEDKKFDLFLWLIQYPQILDSLTPDEFVSTITSFLKQDTFVLHGKYDAALFLPFLKYDSILPNSESGISYSFRLSGLTHALLPFLLAPGDISHAQWVNLYRLSLLDFPNYPQISGVVLNALVRAGKKDLVRDFLTSLPSNIQIPPVSSPGQLTDFPLRYPLLTNRLCAYPREGAQLLGFMMQGLDARLLGHLLGPHTCADILQFLLIHPAVIKDIEELNRNFVSIALRNFKCSLQKLTSQKAIQQALRESIAAHNQHLIERNQRTIDLLPAVLFAHDRYFLKVLQKLQMVEKSNGEFWFVDMLNLITKNGPLLRALSIPPPQDPAPLELSPQMKDLLLAMGCYPANIRSLVPVIGWDTIFKTAENQPEILNVMANFPAAVLHMPEHLRIGRVPQPLLQELQVFDKPQEGRVYEAAQRMSQVMVIHPAWIGSVWRILEEKCSLFRRIALTFRLSCFLPPDQYTEFYKDLPFFYQIIGTVGRIWARFFEVNV